MLAVAMTTLALAGGGSGGVAHDRDVALTARTRRSDLCLSAGGGQAFSAESCGQTPRTPFHPVLLAGPDGRGPVAGAVPAGVAEVELETAAGPVRLPTVAATGFAERFFLTAQ